MWLTFDTRFVNQKFLNILGPILTRASNQTCSDKDKNVFSYSIYTNQFTELIRSVKTQNASTQTEDTLSNELSELGIRIVDSSVDATTQAALSLAGIDAATQTDISLFIPNTPLSVRVLPEWMRADSRPNVDRASLKRKHEAIDVGPKGVNFKPVQFVFNNKAILDLSDIEVPRDVLLLLSFGPKFIPPVMGFDKNQILSDISNPIIPKGIFGKILKLVHEHVNAEPSWRQTQINNLVQLTLAFLNEHPELYVSTTDKGDITVIMSRNDYNQRVLNKIIDVGTLTSVPISQHELLIKKNYTLLLRCAEEGFVSHSSISDILAKETKFSQIFGEVMPHEPDNCRLFYRKFIGNKLSSIISPILNRMNSKNSLSIQSSRDLCHKLKQVKLLEGDMLFGLKIVDLFKKITTDMVWDYIKTLKLNEFSKMSPNLFESIFRFITCEVNEFMFDNKFYKLEKGIPKAFIASLAVAGLSLTSMLVNALSIVRPMTFFCQHEDDILFVTNQPNAALFLNVLNLDPFFEFDSVSEIDNMLNFLDLTIIRKPDCLLYKWYNVPWASNRLINWFSGHDRKTIIGMAIKFVRKLLSLTSPIYRTDVEFLAHGILENNSFPEPVIKNIISNIDRIEYLEKEPTYIFACAPLNLMSTLNITIKNGVQGQEFRFVNGLPCLGDTIFAPLLNNDCSIYRNFVVLELSCKSCDFSCVSPVIYPIVLFTSLGLDYNLHPFYNIQRHTSSLKHASDFDIKVIRICKNKEETLRLAEIEAAAKNLNVHSLAKKSVPEIVRKSGIRK